MLTVNVQPSNKKNTVIVLSMLIVASYGLSVLKMILSRIPSYDHPTAGVDAMDVSVPCSNTISCGLSV